MQGGNRNKHKCHGRDKDKEVIVEVSGSFISREALQFTLEVTIIPGPEPDPHALVLQTHEPNEGQMVMRVPQVNSLTTMVGVTDLGVDPVTPCCRVDQYRW